MRNAESGAWGNQYYYRLEEIRTMEESSERSYAARHTFYISMDNVIEAKEYNRFILPKRGEESEQMILRCGSWRYSDFSEHTVIRKIIARKNSYEQQEITKEVEEKLSILNKAITQLIQKYGEELVIDIAPKPLKIKNKFTVLF